MRSKIKCLMIEPEKPPVICYMKPTKKAFRKAINQGALQRGEIEAKRVAQDVYAIFHKDRFLTNLKPNRALEDDIISGVMFIVATDEISQPISMTDEQVSSFTLRFWNAEAFDEMDVMEANMSTFLSRFTHGEYLHLSQK